MSADSQLASASSLTGERSFARSFMWGSATSAYQVEGAVTADGRGESIWDRFCATPGTIADGSSGAVACDHFHRWRGDIELMREIGLGAYRFSIAWPRVVPDGTGTVNEAGLDFYDRLVDGLLAAGIVPMPTLYHWDLPQALEDKGGWPERATAEAFAEYAGVVAQRLGDRVSTWMTLNEPFVSAHHGYVSGEHAPGRRDVAAGVAAAHHLLVGHGLAVRHIRDAAPNASVGIVLNFTPVVAATDDPADVAEAEFVDGFENRWYVEPICGLGYPEATVQRLGWDRREVLDGDLELIAEPLDVLDVNYYTRQVVRADGAVVETSAPTTAMGWEIHPPSFEELLRSLHGRYRFPRYLVTENGAAMHDGNRRDGRIEDRDRIAFVGDHLAGLHGAIAAGVPIDGYFVWSLLDNFEWAHGYTPRFGIVEVAPGTLERIPKASALWYGDLCRTGTLLTGDPDVT
jgi:beta-glucosidase